MDNQILIAERSGTIALYSATEGEWARTEVAASGRWPTWNPVHDIVAVSRLEADASAPSSSIELFTTGGEHLRTVHQSGTGIPPVIAPRLPHYCLWSPGGNVLSYVAQSSYGLTLFLSAIDGSFTSDPIINGAPLFLAWCTDNNFLGVHAGEELAVVEVEGSRTTANVAHRALGFRTPAFSDDANIMAYALAAEPGVAIMRALFQGMNGREIHRFDGGVALGFRPGTQQLTAAVTRHPDTGTFDELWALDLSEDPPVVSPITRGPLVAFFWSPGGDKLAVVFPAQTGDGRYGVRMHEPGGRTVAVSESFVPSVDYRMILGFFDQYMQSHHLWSADGRQFLVTGRLVNDAVSSSLGDPAGDYVMTWTPEGGQPLSVVAPGEAGFFRPAPKRIH